MARIVKAFSTNRLATSKYYPDILHAYNEILIKEGKVNAKRFHAEFILPRIPEYKLMSWYQFLKRFASMQGLAEVSLSQTINPNLPGPGGPERTDVGQEELALLNAMKTVPEATRLGIMKALNIGEKELTNILENPHLISSKDKIDLLFKAMKAQDSRAKTMAELRRDDREQKTFEEAFSDSAY